MQDLSTTSHRRSIRYPSYDYTQPGAYFVTVVVNGHKCLFGKIINHEMCPFDLGNVAKNCWIELPMHFPNIEIEPFVIMPNHIHGIITILEDDRRGTIYRAPTEQYLSSSHAKFGKPVSGSLATIIRTYKAAVTRIARKELGIVHLWQRNYYEHIIRNEIELSKITGYILTNPQNWLDDPEYIS